MEASFTIVFLLFIAAATAFWVWALVDVIRRPSGTLRAGSQAVWAVVIALTHAIGALVYVLVGRPRPAETVGSVGR
ncbi:MAG: PLDc N-terminal domain-containing protein [Actinomycetota bacterium]|nr:PLDc N-terminal domain-containing protein [Actinomycetota bacterium]